MITEAQLAHWRKLADEATAGEWVVTGQISKTQREIYGDDFQAFDVEARYEDGSDSWYGLTPRCLKQRDAAFIAAARTAVPALLDEVESLRARVAEAEARAQTAEVENGRLREVADGLRNYVAHYPECPKAKFSGDCSCGLHNYLSRYAALAASAPETGEREAK